VVPATMMPASLQAETSREVADSGREEGTEVGDVVEYFFLAMESFLALLR
jgi:hypothetical protein